MPKDAPWAPPIVALNDTTVGHLLCWELHEVSGEWTAWCSWVQQQGGRPVRRVVNVRAGSLQPLDEPGSYENVPRRVLGRDGVIRPWSGEIA